MIKLRNKHIAYLLFSVLILYQLIGVTIHKQYGFGFFYWPIQEGLLIFLSLLFFLTNSDKLKWIFSPKFYLFHLYVLVIILFQMGYLFFYKIDHFDKNEILIVLIGNINYYFISITLILNFNNLIVFANEKYVLIIYFIIVFSFFLYDFHIQDEIFLALTLGPNFPPSLMDALPGYTWGFHLFFSPYFAIYTLFTLSILKENKHYFSLYLISIISLYVLLLSGGRGTFLSFAVVLFLLIYSKKAKIVSILIITFIIYLTTFVADTFSENKRMLELLTFNFGNDGSTIGRLELLNSNLIVIKDNFFLGSYHSYIGSEYMHNILSILQDFGVLGFIIILAIILHGFYLFLSHIKSKNKDITILLAGNIFVFSTIDHTLFKNSSNIVQILPLLVSYCYLILALKTKYIQNNFKVKKSRIGTTN